MTECYGKNFILNGELVPSAAFDNSLVYEGESVYEVIRMNRGTPVFFNDHMERLDTSVRLLNQRQLANSESIRESIIKLSRSDRKKETNLKIVFNYNEGVENHLIYFIEPIYPSENQYRQGVKGVLYFAERKDPESKVINHKLRSSIYHKLMLESAYEALLVNEDGLITEGSRSNIFFIKKGILYTAPEHIILNGITRKHILEICLEIGVKVEFVCVKADETDKYDAAFMTGTSPLVLPFNCIDSVLFDTRLPLIKKLRDIYRDRAIKSIRQFIAE